MVIDPEYYKKLLKFDVKGKESEIIRIGSENIKKII